jgi:hypothetical protein
MQELGIAFDIAGMLPKMPARPADPSPVRLKGGEKTFAADSARIWGAGWRLGAILRKAREETKQPEEKEILEGNEGRRGPAPHIRRAHWHTFWTGPKSGSPRKPALKWIPPIPVAFGDVEPGAPTCGSSSGFNVGDLGQLRRICP